MSQNPWVYIRSEPSLWTVGFYEPNGKWNPESDHSTPEKAAARVRHLSGAREHEVELKLVLDAAKACADDLAAELRKRESGDYDTVNQFRDAVKKYEARFGAAGEKENEIGDQEDLSP